jgi:hypothetical protein
MTMRNLLRLLIRGPRKLFFDPAEAMMICRMAWWVVVLSVSARIYSLPRALQLVAGNPAPKTNLPSQLHQQKLAQAIDLLLSTNLLVFKPICWKRAAVLHRYLAKTGTSTKIMFGVRNEPGGKIDGHAWLEFEGKPILESKPPEYIVTYSFPSNEKFESRLTIPLES